MARIVLFGGSFNPVHYGHLRLCIEALEEANAEEAWLVPSGTPPHREAYSVAPHHRLKMLELAVQEHPRLKVCDHEIECRHTNYTVDTVTALQQRFPEHRFSFLTGLDVISNYRWKGLEELLERLEWFLVASRPGYSFSDLIEKLDGTRNLEKFRSLDIPLHEVSSSLVRQRLQQGRSVEFWIPESVRVYAQRERLYLTTGATQASV